MFRDNVFQWTQFIVLQKKQEQSETAQYAHLPRSVNALLATRE